MILFWLFACEGPTEDWAPTRVVAPDVEAPAWSGRCDGTIEARVELGDPRFEGEGWSATTTALTTEGRTIWLDGEISAVVEHDGALWVALGTGGVARVGDEVQQWRTGGVISALSSDGTVQATDLHGRLLTFEGDEPRIEALPDLGLMRGETRPQRLRIDAVLADSDGMLVARAHEAGGELVRLSVALEILERQSLDTPIRALVLDDAGAVVVGRGGDQLRDLAVSGDRIAAIDEANRVLVLEPDGTEEVLWTGLAAAEPVTVAWWQGRPWAATTYQPLLTDGEQAIGLPGPAGRRRVGVHETGRMRSVGETLVVPSPTHGLTLVRPGPEVELVPMDPGPFDLAVRGQQWVVALGEAGVGVFDPASRSFTARCDLPGTTRRLALTDDGRIVATADTAVFLLQL